MAPVATEERQARSVRQLTTVVPPGARPGETRLSVGLGGTHELHVKVPLEAVPGDKLLLTEGHDSSWVCTVVRRTSSDANRQATAVDQCPTHQRRITLLVPPRVVPGESKLAVRAGNGARIHLTVPSAARPGDMLELRRESAGLGKEDVLPESWQCKLVCDKVARGKLDDCLEHVSKLRPLRASPMCADEACRELFSAARAAGGTVSTKLVRGSAPPLCIPGILAAEPIEEGEELCRIPRDLHISPCTVEALAPELWHAVMAQSELPDSRRREVAQCLFLAQLLHRSEDRTAEDGNETPESATGNGWLSSSGVDPLVCSVWERYADGLLNEDFTYHPYRRAAASPDTIRAALEPSTEAEYFIEMVRDIHTVYELVTAKCSHALSGRWPEFSMFFRARLCILTRVFQTDNDSSLVPVVDLFNHAPNMNHGIAWRWSDTEQAMIAVARRAHAAGEELFCSYGPRSNLLLYRTYGFTHSPDVEPAWTYMVWPDHVRAIYDMFLPEGETRSQLVLDSKHVEDSLCETLNLVCKNGRDAVEFLRLVCARCMWPYERDPALRPALEALQRARQADPSSSAWWSELTEMGRPAAADEFVRIKMCEYLCLTAHADAVDFVDGELHEDQCLLGTEHLRSILADALNMLKTKQFCRLRHVVLDSPD
mmetsp:Transcript_49370/g.143114  ORF Transcript_49370/g.143114 Transcript_49370/m.143114 type:complete len:656 (+) Transcript_49370:48-2015(+)